MHMAQKAEVLTMIPEVVGPVSFFAQSFKGNLEDVRELAQLAGTPDFRRQFPDHQVFAVGFGNRILGALPNLPKDDQGYVKAFDRLT